MMFGSDHGFGGWTYAGMLIGMALFWALLLGGIFLLDGHVNGNDTASPAPAPEKIDPQQLLALRFARGEINEAEYRRKLAVLRGDSRL
ncbi:SHOCT domain-containing protein [Mycobacterium sp. WMMD1722]|uniref:SHOCT domain-containing protein n=1 Tax=Mycobacterium sp. WMMD1722 TaxID=3404117 RepID=UPI003BF60019